MSLSHQPSPLQAACARVWPRIEGGPAAELFAADAGGDPDAYAAFRAMLGQAHALADGGLSDDALDAVAGGRPAGGVPWADVVEAALAFADHVRDDSLPPLRRLPARP